MRFADFGVSGALLFSVCFAAGPSLAAPPPAPTRAPAIQAVVDCHALADDAARLACYDRTVSAMTAAETSGDLVTIDRKQRQAVRRQAFGLTLPSLAMFDRGEKPEEVDRLESTATGASRTVEGKWVVRLEDGAVWRQTDDNELFHNPHAGSKVEIRKGVLGAFFMKVDGQQAVRAHRDN